MEKTKVDKDVLKALASETKTEILKALKKKPLTPTYLAKIIHKNKSTTVEHLKYLLEAGLVEREVIEGRKRIIYRLTLKGREIVAPNAYVSLILFSSLALAFAGIYSLLRHLWAPIHLIWNRLAESAVPKAGGEVSPYVQSEPWFVLGTFLILLAIILFTVWLILRKRGGARPF